MLSGYHQHFLSKKDPLNPFLSPTEAQENTSTTQDLPWYAGSIKSVDGFAGLCSSGRVRMSERLSIVRVWMSSMHRSHVSLSVSLASNFLLFSSMKWMLLLETKLDDPLTSGSTIMIFRYPVVLLLSLLLTSSNKINKIK